MTFLTYLIFKIYYNVREMASCDHLNANQKKFHHSSFDEKKIKR